MVKCAWKTFHSLFPLRFSPLQHELKFLCLQYRWNNWIGPHAWSYDYAANLNRRLIALNVLPRRKSKFSLLSWRLLFNFLHRKIQSNQVKLNFDVQPQKSNIREKTLRILRNRQYGMVITILIQHYPSQQNISKLFNVKMIKLIGHGRAKT